MLQLKKCTLSLCSLRILFKIFLLTFHEPQSVDFFQIFVKRGFSEDYSIVKNDILMVKKQNCSLLVKS